jgi:hypothetical protein
VPKSKPVYLIEKTVFCGIFDGNAEASIVGYVTSHKEAVDIVTQLSEEYPTETVKFEGWERLDCLVRWKIIPVERLKTEKL